MDVMTLPTGQITELALRHGAEHVRVFGSRARGDATETSDLDLLIRPGPKMTLLDLVGLQMELEVLLGINVDVVTEKGLHPLLKDMILKEARELVA